MARRLFNVSGRTRRQALKVSIAPSADDRLPLADAARAVEAAQRGSDLDRMARGLSTSEESLLAFWARHVAQIGVPVYGRRIMSDKPVVVPAEVLLAGRIIDAATRLDIGQGEPAQDFCDLHVKRREFEDRVAAIRSGEPLGD